MSSRVAFPLLALVLFISGCSSSSSPDPIINTETQFEGEWTNNSVIRGGRLASITWSFKGREFVKTTRFIDAPNDPSVEMGTFVVGTAMVMSSGVNGHRLDITYHAENASEGPRTEFDAAYINSGTLYFGRPMISESCEGEVYRKPSLGFEVVNGVIRTLEIDGSACFARPDTIDFDNPYLLSQS